jgi:hypothetical protein
MALFVPHSTYRIVLKWLVEKNWMGVIERGRKKFEILFPEFD